MITIFVLVLFVLLVAGMWALVYAAIGFERDLAKLAKLLEREKQLLDAREKSKHEPQSSVPSTASQSHSSPPSPAVVELPPDIIAPFLKRPPRPTGGYRPIDSEADDNEKES